MIAALAAVLVAASHPVVPHFEHAIVVVFENHGRADVARSSDAPTFAKLEARYASLNRYNAVAHPSLPNYLALISGSTHGIHDDCTECLVGGRSLADTLAAKGKTWKTYAEGLPSAGFTGASSGRYVKKHVPFLYFRRVLSRSARRKRVVPLTQLKADVHAHHLPNFALVIPDLCNDMHDCSIATGDAWLRKHIAPLATLRRTAVFVVFDEGTTNTGGGGNVEALVLGPLVRRGSHARSPTSHYGLLRTLEDAWGLPRLGASAHARPITGIWR